MFKVTESRDFYPFLKKKTFNSQSSFKKNQIFTELITTQPMDDSELVSEPKFKNLFDMKVSISVTILAFKEQI